MHELLRVYDEVETDDARLRAKNAAAEVEVAPSNSRRKREDRVQMASLFARMGAVDRRFSDPRKQQDVQEFLRFLLGYLQDFELSLRPGNGAVSGDKTVEPSDPMQVDPPALEPATPGKRRRASMSRPTSPAPPSKRARTTNDESSSSSSTSSSSGAADTHVGLLFQGDLESTLQCLRCKYVSRRREPFLDLSLTIEKDKALADSLNAFMAEERLTGADRYHCPRCDARTDALRHVRFAALPSVLTFHLKRFTFDEVKRKVTHHISTPLELSLERFTTTDCFNRHRKYELYAIIFHKGTSSACGHYVTVLRDPKLDAPDAPLPAAPEPVAAAPATTPLPVLTSASRPVVREVDVNSSSVRPSPNPKANWVATAPLTRRQRTALEQINNNSDPVPPPPPEQAARSASSGAQAEVASRSRAGSASATPAPTTVAADPTASSPRARATSLRWVVFDDEDVTYLPTHQLTTLLSSQSKSLNTAYILFYKQVFAE